MSESSTGRQSSGDQADQLEPRDFTSSALNQTETPQKSDQSPVNQFLHVPDI